MLAGQTSDVDLGRLSFPLTDTDQIRLRTLHHDRNLTELRKYIKNETYLKLDLKSKTKPVQFHHIVYAKTLTQINVDAKYQEEMVPQANMAAEGGFLDPPKEILSTQLNQWYSTNSQPVMLAKQINLRYHHSIDHHKKYYYHRIQIGNNNLYLVDENAIHRESKLQLNEQMRLFLLKLQKQYPAIHQMKIELNLPNERKFVLDIVTNSTDGEVQASIFKHFHDYCAYLGHQQNLKLKRTCTIFCLHPIGVEPKLIMDQIHAHVGAVERLYVHDDAQCIGIEFVSQESAERMIRPDGTFQLSESILLKGIHRIGHVTDFPIPPRKTTQRSEFFASTTTTTSQQPPLTHTHSENKEMSMTTTAPIPNSATISSSSSTHLPSGSVDAVPNSSAEITNKPDSTTINEPLTATTSATPTVQPTSPIIPPRIQPPTFDRLRSIRFKCRSDDPNSIQNILKYVGLKVGEISQHHVRAPPSRSGSGTSKPLMVIEFRERESVDRMIQMCTPDHRFQVTKTIQLKQSNESSATATLCRMHQQLHQSL